MIIYIYGPIIYYTPIEMIIIIRKKKVMINKCI